MKKRKEKRNALKASGNYVAVKIQLSKFNNLEFKHSSKLSI